MPERVAVWLSNRRPPPAARRPPRPPPAVYPFRELTSGAMRESIEATLSEFGLDRGGGGTAGSACVNSDTVSLSTGISGLIVHAQLRQHRHLTDTSCVGVAY